jgi:hypothetical protein
MTAVTPESLRSKDDNGNRFYAFPPTGELFPGVTTITGGTKGTPFLAPWGSKVAALYAAANLGQLVALAEQAEADALTELTAKHAGVMGEAAIAARARAAGEKAVADLVKKEATRIRDLKRDTGSYVHAVVEALVLWAASPAGAGSDIALPSLPDELAGTLYDDEPIEDVADFMVTGFLNWVADFEPEFLATEMAVFNPDLKVAGTLDMIVALMGRDLDTRGKLIACPGNRWVPCVDVKTGKNLDNTVKEQVTAYRRMKLALLPLGEMVPMPATDASAVLHLRPEYENGYRFEPVSRRDDALAWNRFRRFLEGWTGREAAGDKPGIPAYPLREDGSVPPRLLRDMDGEGYGRAPGALTRAGVDDVELLASMTAQECLELKGIGDATVEAARRLLAAEGFCFADETLAQGEAA